MPKPTVPLHLAARLQRLRQRLDSVDALLVTHPVDIRYLTGFVGEDAWALVPRRGAVTVLSDARFETQIQREAPHVHAVMRKNSLADELARIMDRRGFDQLAIQPAHVSVAMRKTLVKKLGAKRLIERDDQLLDQRAIKDVGEVKAIRKAIAIGQQAYRELLSFLKPGVTEGQAAAFLEYRMRCLGADGTSFPSIVAADDNAALPHAIPGSRKLKAGSLVLIDWGAKYQGYCGDLTRVVALGRMKPKLREIYQVCLDAQQAAIAAIAPGVDLAQVDRVARDWITKAGYGKQFGHSLGHGIGLEVHEQPVLSERAKGVLVPGQIVTVEPGIYLPGLGGVRIEDDVQVTVRGHKVLGDLPKSLESAII